MDKVYTYFVSFQWLICKSRDSGCGNVRLDLPYSLCADGAVRKTEEVICDKGGYDKVVITNFIPLDESEEQRMTWQQAIKVLHDFCNGRPRCAGCPAERWCDRNIFLTSNALLPHLWELPWELPSEEE